MSLKETCGGIFERCGQKPAHVRTYKIDLSIRTDSRRSAQIGGDALTVIDTCTHMRKDKQITRLGGHTYVYACKESIFQSEPIRGVLRKWRRCLERMDVRTHMREDFFAPACGAVAGRIFRAEFLKKYALPPQNS